MPLSPTLSPLVPRGEREKIAGGCVKMRPQSSEAKIESDFVSSAGYKLP